MVTGYSQSVEEGTQDGITATGTKVKKGVCAVDPRFVRMGSILYIPGYGLCRAEDTGGDIKYFRIDAFFPTRDEAFAWGRRTVTVLLEED